MLVELDAEAVEIANQIQAQLVGRNTAPAFLAIGMVLGYCASPAEHPDIDALMAHLTAAAKAEFKRQRATQGPMQ